MDKESVTVTHLGKPVARMVLIGEAPSERGSMEEMATFITMVGQITEMSKALAVETTIKTTTNDKKAKKQHQKSSPVHLHRLQI